MRIPSRNSSRGVLIAVALCVAMLAGCAADPEPVKTDQARPSPSPSATAPREAAPPTDTAPLRGLIVPKGTLDHASIAAKIDNHPEARPQIALDRTDLVFEELVEGGMTRYVGVWHSDIPDVLGPVRSIRPMDPDIISPLGGIVAYSGGQDRFIALMRQAPVYNAIHGQPDTQATFYRSGAKPAPHNVHVKAKELLAEHTDLAAPRQQFGFAADIPSSTAVRTGTPTAVVNYRFSDYSFGSWTWDSAAAVFLRAQRGTPDLDANGAQLRAANLVVLRVAVTQDREIPKTEMIGSGEAWVSAGGSTVHGTWTKKTPAGTISLIADSGVAIKLAPGNSWIELIPATGSVDHVAPAAG
jgi:hypothetical protein